MNSNSQRHLGANFMVLGALLGALAISACADVQAQENAPIPAKNGLTLLDAVNASLANQPLLQIQEQQVQINRGLRQQASGLFDTSFNSSINQSRTNSPLTRLLQQQAALGGVLTADLVTNLTSYNAGTEKLFRNGVSANIVLGMTRLADNLTGVGGVNASHLNLVVSIPLLRGLGNKAVAAQEATAALEVDASALDLAQLTAQLMANAASSYWRFVAAQENLKIAQDSEQRGRSYVDNVQAFIDADRVPRSDIHEVTANLAGRTATRISAQHQVELARLQLALDIGLPPEQMLDMPNAVDDFPNAETDPLPPSGRTDMQYYVGESLRQRADFLATKIRIAEARRLLAAAHNQLLPAVNLNVITGYSGLGEGRGVQRLLVAPATGVQGMDAALGITYSFPSRNQAAQGQLAQNVAALKQAELRSAQVAENITAAVSVEWDAVRTAIAQLKKARESVNSFQLALAAERERYRMGISSVVEVLTVEDALTTALINQVQAQLDFATAVTRLRLATGTLIAPDKPVQSVDRNIFFTIPFADVPQGH